MVDKNLNENAEHIFDWCWKEINEFSSLKAEINEFSSLKAVFVKICMKKEIQDTDNETDVESEVNLLLSDMVSVMEILPLIEHMMEFIVKKFLLIMLAQFRKDILQAFKISKSMEHRKQIQIRKAKKDTSSGKSLSYDEILKDSTENKKMSHALLQGMILRKVPVLENMTKKQLILLIRAYGSSGQSKLKKEQLVDNLSKLILQSSQMSQVSVFQGSDEIPSTSTASSADEILALPSTSFDIAVPSTSAQSHDDLTDTDLCKICKKLGRKGTQ
jgi:hypothetical protein